MATRKGKGSATGAQPAKAGPDREAIRAAYEAQRRELGQALRAAGLGAREGELRELVRDTIAVTLVPIKGSAAPGASRLGGVPDLPPGTAWPEVRGEALPFLGQLRLEEVAPYDIHGKLPSEGLLSMFVGRLLDANGVPEVEARVLCFGGGADLVAAKPPLKPLKPLRVELAPRAVLPPYASSFVGLDPAYQDFYDTRYPPDSEEPQHGLFGFDRPREHVLTPAEEILLRVDAAPYVPYDFVEAAVVYVVMPRAALAARAFGAARAFEGATL